MNVLITAGGTTENIDTVRTISNNSTGKLGTAIAEAFINAQNCQVDKIYYLCGRNAAIPQNEIVKIISITGVDDLIKKISELLTTEKIDVVIHSMAVSDYAVDVVTSKSKVVSFIAAAVNKHLRISGSVQEDSVADIINMAFSEINSLSPENKISSEINDLIISMKKTQKVIGIIKKLQPSTLLVGFKLLSNVDLNTLLDTGFKLLEKNNCDLVLANDLSQINATSHRGHLITPDKTYETFDTKNQIAAGIVKRVADILEAR